MSESVVFGPIPGPPGILFDREIRVIGVMFIYSDFMLSLQSYGFPSRAHVVGQ